MDIKLQRCRTYGALTGPRSQAMFPRMDYDYSQRNYLLPEGCKDLIDVIEPKMAVIVTGGGFVVTATLSEEQCEDIKITVERNTLRIVAGKHVSRVIEVPGGYAIGRAQAIYSDEQLRIVIPKAAI